MTYFVVLRMIRSSCAYVFYKRGVLQNGAKFTEKHVCRILFLIKLSLQLIKKRLRHMCFHVSFSKLLSTAFLSNTSGQLLLNADDWKNPHNRWLKIWFLALCGFSFSMIAFWRTFSWDVETLSSNFLLKSEVNHLRPQIFLLCYQWYDFHVW